MYGQAVMGGPQGGMPNMASQQRNMLIQDLQRVFPDVVLMRQEPDRQEYRVPMRIKVSPQPLYVNIILSNSFPTMPPQIKIMSRVTHQSIDANYLYCGPAIMGWNATSKLSQLVSEIQHEFNMTPPMPQTGPIQPAPQRRQTVVQKQTAAQETIVKPTFRDLKKRIDTQMDDSENKLIENISSSKDDTMLKNLMICEPEIENIQKVIDKNIQEVEQLSNEVKEKKQELKKMTGTYEDVEVQIQTLIVDNDTLKKDVEAKCVTKKQVSDLLTKKLKDTHENAKNLEKAFVKDKSLDMDQFIKQYMNARKDYHKVNMYKTKVNA